MKEAENWIKQCKKMTSFQWGVEVDLQWAKSRLGGRIPRKLKKRLKKSITSFERLKWAEQYFNIIKVKLTCGFDG